MSATNTGSRAAGPLQAAALLFPITMAVMASVALQPDQVYLIAHFSNLPVSLVLAALAPGSVVPADVIKSVQNTEVLIGVMTTVPSIAAAVFAVVSGYLADLFGRRRVLLIAVFAYVFVGCGPYYLSSFAAVFACRIGVGLCEAVVLTVTTAMLGDYFKGAVRDRMMGFQTTIASVSASVMIPVAGLLASKIGWNGPFLIYLLAAVWFLGVLLFTWEPTPDHHLGETLGSASWEGFPWMRMIEICSITVLGSYLFYTLQFEVTKFMPHFGVVDPAAQGVDAGLMSWGMAVGSFLYMFFVKRPVGQLLVAELGIAAAAYFGMANATSEHMLVVAGFLNQMGCGAILPTLLVASMRFLPFEHRGRGTGIWQGTFAAGQFLVGFSFPYLKDALGGDYGKGFEVVGSVTAVAAVVALVLAIRTHGRIAPAD